MAVYVAVAERVRTAWVCGRDALGSIEHRAVTSVLSLDKVFRNRNKMALVCN